MLGTQADIIQRHSIKILPKGAFMESLLTFVDIRWVKPLAAMLKKIRGERAKEVQALKDGFGDFTPLLNYYVAPNSQHHNPADYHEDEKSRSWLKAPLHESLQAFLGGETLERDGRNQLFILADAGMGKTSALLMLKLWHLFAFWPQGYGCLLLKLGDNSLERIATQEGKANTVLLLDALDEDPLARGRIAERLKELLDASRNYRQVLITCRTQFFPPTGLDPFGEPGRVTLGGYRCPMLFLSLFDDDQVKAYLRKRFPNRWRWVFGGFADPRCAQAQNILGSMQSLRFRPLLLSYVDELLKAEGRFTDAYGIFQALIKVWLLREIGKMEQQKLSPVPSESELWAACRLLAVYLQCLGRRELTEAELGGLMQRLPAVAHLQKLDFGGRALLNRNSSRDYRFAHYSIQEFLVAHALREGGLRQDLDCCPEPALGKRPRVTAQMLEFLQFGAVGGGSALLDWQDFPVAKLLDMAMKGEIRPEILMGMGFRSELKDGGSGPEMVLLPAGTFFMGAGKNDPGASKDEYPRHQVAILRPFAISRYPVTFEDYDRFCEATKRNEPGDAGWGRDRRPVIDISWQDAQDYCDWLSEQAGQHYRLPSEAEWEYAARAGTETAYWWGDEIGVNHANCRNSDSEWSGKQTSPVGSFPANSFGLHDTAGNVREWVQDRWHDSYQGAPDDGSAWEVGGGSSRVLRGGSWDGVPHFARCADRHGRGPGFRASNLGFRLVCASPIPAPLITGALVSVFLCSAPLRSSAAQRRRGFFVGAVSNRDWGETVWMPKYDGVFLVPTRRVGMQFWRARAAFGP